MANKKFSEFTLEETPGEGVFVVGYAGGVNIRIPIAALMGAFIPLAGTAEGSPVTGDVEMDDAIRIKPTDGNSFDIGDNAIGSSYLNFQYGGTAVLVKGSPDDGAKGIGSNVYFPNKDPNTYAQMADLPLVANNFANDAAAAVGGIAVGGLYHTSGTVKIRLA